MLLCYFSVDKQPACHVKLDRLNYCLLYCSASFDGGMLLCDMLYANVSSVRHALIPHAVSYPTPDVTLPQHPVKIERVCSTLPREEASQMIILVVIVGRADSHRKAQRDGSFLHVLANEGDGLMDAFRPTREE